MGGTSISSTNSTNSSERGGKQGPTPEIEYQFVANDNFYLFYEFYEFHPGGFIEYRFTMLGVNSRSSNDNFYLFYEFYEFDGGGGLSNTASQCWVSILG